MLHIAPFGGGGGGGRRGKGGGGGGGGSSGGGSDCVGHVGILYIIVVPKYLIESWCEEEGAKAM